MHVAWPAVWGNGTLVERTKTIRYVETSCPIWRVSSNPSGPLNGPKTLLYSGYHNSFACLLNASTPIRTILCRGIARAPVQGTSFLNPIPVNNDKPSLLQTQFEVGVALLGCQMGGLMSAVV